MFAKNYIYLLLLFCLSCTQEKSEKHPHTFYYWRTTLSLNSIEKQALKAANTDKLYVRLLDIDKQDNRVLPLAQVKKDSSFVFSQKIVPVIFITNRIWKNITPKEIDFIANKTWNFIQDKYRQFNWEPPQEVQIDSDWTAGTRQDYFKFLELLKQKSGKKITCTLRLHQIKDKEKTGIPPVDKGYLMCYATESPLENSTKNSILDINLLKNYLYKIEEYPLAYDVALPLYSWGIVSNHMGRKKLINAVTTEELVQNTAFNRIDSVNFRLAKDTFFHGMYLSRGFKIKVEEISPQQLDKVINFLDDKTQQPYHLIYYHLDSKFIRHFPYLFK